MDSKKSFDQQQGRRRSVHRGFKSPMVVRSAADQHTPGSKRNIITTSSSQDQHTQSHSQVGAEWKAQEEVELDKVLLLQRSIHKGNQEMEESEKEIQQLRDDGCDESELAQYIDKLHTYNELKDQAQMVLGHIANLQGVRVKDLYPKYGLELDD